MCSRLTIRLVDIWQSIRLCRMPDKLMCLSKLKPQLWPICGFNLPKYINLCGILCLLSPNPTSFSPYIITTLLRVLESVIPCIGHIIIAQLPSMSFSKNEYPVKRVYYCFKEGLRCISNVWPCSTYIKNE